MLCQLTRQYEPHRSLNLARSDGRFLVVSGETRCLLRQFLEDVVNKTIHDAHGLAGDPDVRMDLLQDLEYIDLVGFYVLLCSLLLFVCGRRILRKLFLGSWLLLGGSLLSRGLLLGGLFLGFRGQLEFGSLKDLKN